LSESDGGSRRKKSCSCASASRASWERGSVGDGTSLHSLGPEVDEKRGSAWLEESAAMLRIHFIARASCVRARGARGPSLECGDLSPLFLTKRRQVAALQRKSPHPSIGRLEHGLDCACKFRARTTPGPHSVQLRPPASRLCPINLRLATAACAAPAPRASW